MQREVGLLSIKKRKRNLEYLPPSPHFFFFFFVNQLIYIACEQFVTFPFHKIFGKKEKINYPEGDLANKTY